MVQVTWPRWPPCPYMVKTLKNLLLQNQRSYDIETWHVESGTQGLRSSYKWWPWVDLDLFYDKVKLCHLYVWMGKTVTKSFNGGKLAAKDYIDWIILLIKTLTPWGLSAPARGYIHVYNHYFQTSSFLKPLGQSMPNFMWCLLGQWERKFIYNQYRSHDQDGRHAHIYCKNLKKSSPPEPGVLWSWNLACSIGG